MLASCWNLPINGPEVLVESPVTVICELGLVGAFSVSLAWGIRQHRLLPRLTAWILLAAVHLFWLVTASLFGMMLAWSVPTWLWVGSGALTVLTVAAAARPRSPLQLPIALPLGVVLAALLSGWGREDGYIRCDDYLRLRSFGATVLIPSTPEIERCVPGESLMVQRYPRRFWEYPDKNRFIVTTQRGLLHYALRGETGAVWFGGAVCRTEAGSGRAPDCFFDGKAQAIAESRRFDRLYVAGHDAVEGRLFALPREGPFQPLAEARVEGKVGGAMYLDDEHDSIGLFDDEGLYVYRLRASDLSPIDRLPAPFTPDHAHYDQRLHQGIICAGGDPLHTIDGQSFLAVAFGGAPPSFRPLAPSSRYPSSWLGGTWGCDWDPSTRRAYVAVAPHGLLEEIDYDTGRIVRWSFVGFGARAVAFDAGRRRIYLAFFLRGDVLAIDADTGAIVDRWFAGRFVRYIALARDQNSLLATSTLGIVRIPLPAVAQETVAPGS